MKKILLFSILITIIITSQTGFASSKQTLSTKDDTQKQSQIEATIATQKGISNAGIGFSTKSIFSRFGNEEQSQKRLPTTGESLGIGISLLGLMLIILIFKNDLKEVIKNKKKIKGEECK